MPQDAKSEEYWSKNAPGLANTGATLDSIIDSYQVRFGYTKEECE